MLFTNKIIVKRDSVCMADDCTAPNRCEFTFGQDDTVKELVIKISRYVPDMKDVVWSINLKGAPIAYVNFCPDDKKFELNINNIKISELEDNNIYCKFYSSNKLMDFTSNPPELLYPECKTLLQKVKKHEINRKDYY